MFAFRLTRDRGGGKKKSAVLPVKSKPHTCRKTDRLSPSDASGSSSCAEKKNLTVEESADKGGKKKIFGTPPGKCLGIGNLPMGGKKGNWFSTVHLACKRGKLFEPGTANS